MPLALNETGGFTTLFTPLDPVMMDFSRAGPEYTPPIARGHAH